MFDDACDPEDGLGVEGEAPLRLSFLSRFGGRELEEPVRRRQTPHRILERASVRTEVEDGRAMGDFLAQGMVVISGPSAPIMINAARSPMRIDAIGPKLGMPPGNIRRLPVRLKAAMTSSNGRMSCYSLHMPSAPFAASQLVGVDGIQHHVTVHVHRAVRPPHGPAFA